MRPEDQTQVSLSQGGSASNPAVGAPLGVADPQELGVQAASPSAAADDGELIEAEWIEIIKRIIQENRQDPYLLSRAMTMLRADYLKKRYKKDIRIPE